MTNAELTAEIRKPGKIEMPVLTQHGTVHLIVEKGDLLERIARGEPSAPAEWEFYESGDENIRRLDVAS